MAPHSPADHASPAPTNARLATARIVRRQDFTDDLFVLWLQPEIEFVFAPGQYVTIGAAGIERPYSIVSAPYEPYLELFIEYVLPEYGGTFTPILHTRRVGDMLTMRPKTKGRFTLRAGVRNHVMVATVTRIAPYVSMVRQFVHDREIGLGGVENCRFFIMQGASHDDEFVYDRELSQLSREYPDTIQFVCSVSRPWSERDAGWIGPVGRINLLIEEYLNRWDLSKDDTRASSISFSLNARGLPCVSSQTRRSYRPAQCRTRPAVVGASDADVIISTSA